MVVAAAAVRQEARWQHGSGGSGSIAVAAWQQLGRGCGRVGGVGGSTGGSVVAAWRWQCGSSKVAVGSRVAAAAARWLWQLGGSVVAAATARR